MALTYELYDADGGLIEKTEAPIEYLHGGYDGIFPLVEKALAGRTLHFDCRVTSVRAATAEEITHGHVHGPEGHHH